jgi:uncharacterized Zn finger protein
MAYDTKPKRESDQPRKVRGGIKLGSRPVEGGWGGASWRALVEAVADAKTLEQGRNYAELGQTKRMGVVAGRIHAEVQGRVTHPYRVSILVHEFTEGQWAGIVSAMVRQPALSARLLAGELAEGFQSVITEIGLDLVPTDPTQVKVSCTCPDPSPWCKHVCCVGLLVAELFDAEPERLLVLRGLSVEGLVDRIRHRRSMIAAGSGTVPVYQPRVSDATKVEPLEACLDRFWRAGPELTELDLPVTRPVVSHPILRRLGPSPLPDARFPLLGLLATCYQLVSDATISAATEDDGRD